MAYLEPTPKSKIGSGQQRRDGKEPSYGFDGSFRRPEQRGDKGICLEATESLVPHLRAWIKVG